MAKVKQTDRVLAYMQEVGSIIQLDALRELGVMRLASRISDLKRMGYPIVASTESVKTRYGKASIKRYSLRG